jgi:hypothetical protein
MRFKEIFFIFLMKNITIIDNYLSLEGRGLKTRNFVIFSPSKGRF